MRSRPSTSTIGRDQRDDVLANELDVGALVHGQPVRQFHQRGGRAGFGRMNGAGDVVNRRRGGDELVGFGVVHLYGARVGELRQPRAVLVELRDQLLRRHGHRDHLAAFFGLADAEDLHARAGLLQHPHVAVDFVRVGQNPRRAGDVAKHGLRSRHGLRGRQIIGQRRIEEGLGSVLADFLRVLLVDRLVGVAARLKRNGGGGLGEERHGERNGTR